MTELPPYDSLSADDVRVLDTIARLAKLPRTRPPWMTLAAHERIAQAKRLMDERRPQVLQHIYAALPDYPALHRYFVAASGIDKRTTP